MNFKINKIILWPKKDGYPRREIDFNEDKINVIVGDSQTGKSSIIPIIDYCLGSSKCTIPVGPIRDCTSWFGILVTHDNTKILIARKEPGTHLATSEMYYEEGKSIIIPERITDFNKRNNKQVVNRLNQLDKLPSLDFATDSEDKKAYEERPSFKDFLAFCFQPQHIIANPYTLFYKADTIEHRFKLTTIFPLALGLIKNETLELEKRLKLLREELKRVTGLIEDKHKIRKAWETEVKANYITALDLGILTDTPFPEEDWTLENYVVFLQKIPERMKSFKFPKISEGVSNKIISYKSKIERKEKELLNDIDEKRFKLHQIKSFNLTSQDYRAAVNNQKGRLELAQNGWLSAKLNTTVNKCPVCGMDHENSNKNIQQLLNVYEGLSNKISQINSAKDLLDKEVTVLEREILDIEKEVNKIRVELDGIGRQNEQIEKQRKDIETVYRYVGRIEQNLKNLDEISIDGSLFKEEERLRKDITSIQSELSSLNNSNRFEDVMQRISHNINIYKEILRVENYSNPTRLDIKELTLRISSGSGRQDYLWEIGSGSNWMGFHLSVALALQEFFLTIKSSNHVPTFIVFDQPSQAYFPEAIRSDEQGQLASDDLVRVKAIFEAMSAFMKKTKNKTQIIVLEHASSEIWGDVEGTNYVDGIRWNKNNALIPTDWFE